MYGYRLHVLQSGLLLLDNDLTYSRTLYLLSTGQGQQQE